MGQRLTLLADEYYCYERDPPTVSFLSSCLPTLTNSLFLTKFPFFSKGEAVDMGEISDKRLGYNQMNYYVRLFQTKASRAIPVTPSKIGDHVPEMGGTH